MLHCHQFCGGRHGLWLMDIFCGADREKGFPELLDRDLEYEVWSYSVCVYMLRWLSGGMCSMSLPDLVVLEAILSHFSTSHSAQYGSWHTMGLTTHVF